MNDLEIESFVISNLREPENLSYLVKKGVTEQDFVELRNVYQWIIEFVKKYNKLPEQGAIVGTFKDFEVKPQMELPFLVDEIKRRTALRAAKEILFEKVPKLDEETYDTIESIVHKLSTLTTGSNLSISMTDRDVMSRYEKYLDSGKEIEDRIPTGLWFFDNRKAYYNRGEFIVYIARTFVGKTWFLLNSCAVAWSLGKRVLIVSPEMGIAEAELRMDVIGANLSNVPILLTDLRYGSDSSRDNYKAFAEIAKERQDIMTIDNISGRNVTPSALKQLAQQFKPDIIAIDGINFMKDDENSRDGWQRILNVSLGLKNLAATQNCVVLAVQQVKPQVPGHRVPTLEDVAYGDGLVQTADRIVTISYNEEHTHLRDCTVQKDRFTGEVITDRTQIYFNPNTGDIGKEPTQAQRGSRA